MKLHALSIVSSLWLLQTQYVNGSILVDDDDEGARCTGLLPDISRLVSVTVDDLEKLTNPGVGRSFSLNSFTSQTSRSTGMALSDRVRLDEQVDQINIHGTGLIVTFKPCNGGICSREIKNVNGKTFQNITVDTGLDPQYTEDEAREAIADYYDTDVDSVSELRLEVFVSTPKDYLAYFGDVLIEDVGNSKLFEFAFNSYNMELLFECKIVDQDVIPSRRLRGEDLHRNLVNCQSCAESGDGIVWSTDNEECQVNTLYLDDTDRTTTCIVGDQDGEKVLGPGPVPDLNWGGSFDCKSAASPCEGVELPTCSDAISDVQFAALKTMEFLQDKLGVMGGFSQNGGDYAVMPKAYVHYNSRYCNAFYRYSRDAVFFGDCNCYNYNPLVSIDIVAHEIAHGVTRHSSRLAYEYESGGMNEAFSDIIGTVVEFYIDDSFDRPDFNIGEKIGSRLRSMEFPSSVGRNIDSVCDYSSTLNVHHTSGPFNRAFVVAAKACASSCATLYQCVELIGSIFMYGNIQSLSEYSGYLDGASAICDIVDEYFMTQEPSTNCEIPEVIESIREGFAAVDIIVNTTTCQAVSCCGIECSDFLTRAPTQAPVVPPTLAPTLSVDLGDIGLVGLLFRWIFSSLFGFEFGP